MVTWRYKISTAILFRGWSGELERGKESCLLHRSFLLFKWEYVAQVVSFLKKQASCSVAKVYNFRGSLTAV